MIIFSTTAFILINDYFEYKKDKDAIIDLKEDVLIENNNQDIIDWEKLEDINTDIIGWIEIRNTNINYPILKDDGNLKYLKHSYDLKYSNSGSIFTLNNDPFQDNVTVIYGHNMKNGLMFSELGKYLNENFYKQHSEFIIYTKDQKYKAIVFSCYSINVYEEEQNIKKLDLNDEIEYYKNKSSFSTENIGEVKKIVKLSTCSYINNHTTPTSQRYFIIAKLEKID